MPNSSSFSRVKIFKELKIFVFFSKTEIINRQEIDEKRSSTLSYAITLNAK